MKIDQLSQSVCTSMVPWQGEEVAIRHRHVTPAIEARVRELTSQSRQEEDPAAGPYLVGALLEILVGWDVTDETGREVPVTRDVLGELPIPFLLACLESATATIRPNQRSGGTSAAGS